MSRPASSMERDLIPRVKQYLEENVHRNYVDVEEMAQSLMTRYPDYSRLKQQPFRILVETAYKTVLHTYGIESNPGSENDDVGSDLEVMDLNHMTNTLNSLYMKKKPTAAITGTTDTDAAAISIDISSDEEENGGTNNKPSKPPSIPIDSTKVTVSKVSANGSKVIATTEELASLINSRPGPASQKRRRLEQLEENVKQAPTTTKEKPSSTAATLKPKKFKKEVYAKRSSVLFSDVGGMTKTLEEICELALHIKHPNIYRTIGSTPPRGFLLHGPSGSGKTLLAHAIAGQLDVFLIEVAATELIAGVSGESEERIREVFEQAASFAPCVLFIDEIDAISSNRVNAQKDMERRIVAQLLQSFDNLSKLEYGDQVLVIGATNRPDSLDPSLRRVGRFDHEICIGIPDRKAREDILEIITGKMKIEEKFNYEEMAALTPGFVGADLLALTSRAASTCVKRVLEEKERDFADKEKEKEEAAKTLQAAKEIQAVVKPVVNVDIDEDLLMEVDTEAKVQENSDEKEESKKADEEPKEEAPMEEVENTIAAPIDETEDKTESTEKIEEPEVKLPEIKPKNELTLATMLKFLQNENQPLSESELEKLTITRQDFLDALKQVQPSAKREGFITVPDVTWDDIGSLQDIRKELKLSILAPVKYPHLMEALGLKSPSGVFLWGPPGCGKTLLAKAVANEAGINFISVKGPELLNMYVGESERAVRQCFQRARNSAPCVIFFDEFDALCPKRSDSGDGNATQRVVNQLLTEMDGIQERKGVFLMAASNRPDIIDPAILRPGRLDKNIYVGLPAKADRIDIIQALTKNGTKPEFADDVDLNEIANMTDRFTGADLAGLVREASYKIVEKAFNFENGEMADIKAYKSDFANALIKMKPSVSEQDFAYYEKLKLKYAS